MKNIIFALSLACLATPALALYAGSFVCSQISSIVAGSLSNTTSSVVEPQVEPVDTKE